ncbi:MAG: hypothetical protein CMP59_12300 [Flavobacteriales bacterium]|nr:hypothetical protein [Flavobacteriales bacterium]
MKHSLFFLIFVMILVTVSLFSCSYYPYPPAVKKRTSNTYVYKDKLFQDWENSTWRTRKFKGDYRVYDREGNEIEIGEYGERWGKVEVKWSEDSSIIGYTSYSGTYPKRLNTVTYNEYNEKNQLISQKVWQYHKNKKHHLAEEINYTYKNDTLYLEIEYEYYNDDTSQTVTNHYLENLRIAREIKSSIETGRPRVTYDTVYTGNDYYSTIDSIYYDTSGREIEAIHYMDESFLYRQEFKYSDDGLIKTELRFDDEPDSLWAITEWRFDYFSKEPIRKYWNVINSGVERRTEYLYNKKGLLKRIDVYDASGKTQYTKFRYRLH